MIEISSESGGTSSPPAAGAPAAAKCNYNSKLIIINIIICNSKMM